MPRDDQAGHGDLLTRGAALLAIGITLALALPATAGHCTTYSTSQTSVYWNLGMGEPGPISTATLGELGLHVHCMNWGMFMDCAFYAETNQIPGLQRGDDIRDDTCHGAIAPDTWVF